MDLHHEQLIENCGARGIELPVRVVLLAGSPDPEQGLALRETWTAPGMAAGLAEWVTFDVPFAEWEQVRAELGETYYIVVDPDDAVDECSKSNNTVEYPGPCPW